MRLLLYEHLTASAGCGPELPASLATEGWAMLSGVLEDCRDVPQIEPHTIVGPAIHTDLPATLHRVEAAQGRLAGFDELLPLVDAVLIIAPEFDRILESLIRRAEDRKKVIVGCTSGAIALTADKYTCGRHLSAHGVSTPACQEFHANQVARPLPDTHYPVVLKPRDGAGSLATILISDADSQSQAFSAVEDENPSARWIIQPFMPGTPASVSCIGHKDGVLALPAASQRLSNDGRFRYAGGELPLGPALQQRAQNLAQRAVSTIDGVCGFVGVDLILGPADDGREDYVIEINPRITTSYLGLRALCRQNLMKVILAACEGQAIHHLNWKSGKIHFQADGSIREFGRNELNSPQPDARE